MLVSFFYLRKRVITKDVESPEPSWMEKPRPREGEQSTWSHCSLPSWTEKWGHLPSETIWEMCTSDWRRKASLRANVSMHQINSGKSPKICFTPTFIFCSPICPDNCGVVFLWKYILVFEKWFFSFDRSNMQFFTVNITRVVRPRVTNTLDLRYFCQHNSSFYHLNLIPCHYWSWQSHIYILVNTFVRHTFPLSNSSIKTETVLTMTDMTESTELRAFKRQKDG